MLTVIAAFKREAAPIIRHYSLQATNDYAGYRVFKGCGIRLGISGAGVDNVRQLTQVFLAADQAGSARTGWWLNFGIAGSGAWPVGSMVFADTVLYPATGERWSLNTEFIGGNIRTNSTWMNDRGRNNSRTINTAVISTVDSPDSDYRHELVYEMEAAGMLSELSDRQVRETTLVAKLISDGPCLPLEYLNKDMVDRLIHRNAAEILKVVGSLDTSG